jgi:hypothetical protein
MLIPIFTAFLHWVFIVLDVTANFNRAKATHYSSFLEGLP